MHLPVKQKRYIVPCLLELAMNGYKVGLIPVAVTMGLEPL